MEREMVERLAGEVVIGEDFGGVHGVLGGVVLRINFVVHDPLRHGRGRIHGDRVPVIDIEAASPFPAFGVAAFVAAACAGAAFAVLRVTSAVIASASAIATNTNFHRICMSDLIRMIAT